MVTVIGAGPAGSYYAANEKHEDIQIIEEHRKIGQPISCTGILTDSIHKVFKAPKDSIVTKINQFKIIAPNNKSCYIKLNKPNIVVDRCKFDTHIFNQAIDNGAEIKLGERFLGLKKHGQIYTVKTNKRTYQTNMIVGADGPFSPVGRAAKMFSQRQYVKGWQARCKFKDLEPNTTIVKMNMGEFAWIVPEDNNIARVGVIGQSGLQLKQNYEKLIGASKIIEDQSGVVPLYNHSQLLRKGNIFLIGDAATQVKATTYGGVLYGLHAAKMLANNKDSYPSLFKKTLGKELWLSLKMRDMMNHMNDKQANELIQIFSKKSNSQILGKYDRDFPSKFILQLLLKEPKLWPLGMGILKNKIIN